MERYDHGENRERICINVWESLDSMRKSGSRCEDHRFSKRLERMYASDIFRQHNVYPSMGVDRIYAVIAVCLELKDDGMSDPEIIDFVNRMFEARRKPLRVLLKGIDLLPDCYQIAKKWNIGDHAKRTADGSFTYDSFVVSDGKIEYTISKCMYAEIFEYYGIRSLCKIFCLTDEFAYGQLTRHVEFIRYSDLSDGNCCHDEIIDRKRKG
ncbi:MAG: L-2-amino-thiazoline-4-carboxylic acid hydrolase [Clostridia bacterium]|nr:L-2-amino-thiazoline-4-carboxylic acid hydrolase [Clostridia bacterium]